MSLLLTPSPNSKKQKKTKRPSPLSKGWKKFKQRFSSVSPPSSHKSSDFDLPTETPNDGGSGGQHQQQQQQPQQQHYHEQHYHEQQQQQQQQQQVEDHHQRPKSISYGAVVLEDVDSSAPYKAGENGVDDAQLDDRAAAGNRRLSARERIKARRRSRRLDHSDNTPDAATTTTGTAVTASSTFSPSIRRSSGSITATVFAHYEDDRIGASRPRRGTATDLLEEDMEKRKEVTKRVHARQEKVCLERLAMDMHVPVQRAWC